MKEQYIKNMPEKSRTPLYVAFTAIGLVGGVTGYQALEINEQPIPQYQEAQPIPTIDVNVVVEFPTPTPTNTPTPAPEPTSTPKPMDFCVTPVLGSMCRIPEPPRVIPTPTPFPNCFELIGTPTNRGEVCVWQGETK